MTLEMGKPHQGRDRGGRQVRASVVATTPSSAARFSPTSRSTRRGERSYVAYEPIGVVLAVMPWNFPFWQVIRFAAPALAAGNVGLLKHASNVPQCALALEQLFNEAGAPGGVFQTFAHRLATRSQRSSPTIASPRRRSPAAKAAGRERRRRTRDEHIKKTVLELGGSDPFIVMPSADLDARGDDGGDGAHDQQRPIVHRREAVHRRRRDRRRVHAAIRRRDARARRRRSDGRAHERRPARDGADPRRSRRSGADAPSRPGRAAARRKSARRHGILLRADGARRHRRRFAGVSRRDVRSASRRVIRARDVDDAIAIANDSRFGLGAAAWTSDAAETERFARGLVAGSVFINGMVASDPRFPFGGVKKSGYGRELSAFGHARVREHQDGAARSGRHPAAPLSQRDQ